MIDKIINNIKPKPNDIQIGLRSHIQANCITLVILRTITEIIPRIKIVSTILSLKSSGLIL